MAQEGHVIARPSQLVQQETPGPARRSRFSAGSRLVSVPRSTLSGLALWSRMLGVRQELLANTPASSRTIVGTLIAMVAVGAIVALIAR
jgi:hypothetical protein